MEPVWTWQCRAEPEVEHELVGRNILSGRGREGQGRHQEVGLEVVEWTGVGAGVTALT